ncbi:probable tRNA (uracil-O(2)-)-methyltransferase [Perognathus longimembris pacificus]|uniref:probable tRNA (uracil-O(2)-)-methyltransferase n=1 Tax=Perognathus longimembris pacificus TaxID=214514 RepID=UPI002018DC41|nr:probable tRNA (uracil-O(2)-)-methyltransferase [Perognathus longimembris pacificus]
MVELGRVPVRDPGALLPEGFWAAVAVWLERPQVANKRLCGARLEARRSAGGPGPGPGPGAGPAPGPTGGGREHEHGHGHGRGGRRRGEAHAAGPGQTPQAADLEGLWERFSQSLAEDSPEMLAFLTGPGEASRPPAPAPLQLVLRTLIPKACPHRLASPRREIVVQDVSRGTATFLPLGEDSEGNLRVQMSNVYQIQLIHTKGEWFISILIFCPEKWHSDGVIHPNPAWLAEELLPRMARWAVENKKREFKSTLSLISIMNYSRTYQELKEKYKDMVKVWPEVTDPEKFVYEDVAIATYLLVLWEEERAERGLTARQSFVDLGCGNGLLVHILCSEGHPGRGIDVRRRKIWDMYGPQTRLEEGAITPDDKTLFPGVDWLLGNHSDELTPWVPVIAARSSYDCCFFVLPCCFFDFAGKYRRRQSQKTQYREYLDFIREVGLSCGFHVQEDCLRIPSTKRVCLIGKSRTYPASGEAWMDEQRTRYIDGRRCCPVSPPGGERSPSAPRAASGSAEREAEAGPAERGAEDPAARPWLPGFRPRERAPRVRNCAALPPGFVDQVVLQVAELLLGGKRPSSASPREGSSEAWNPGESLSLAEVARALDREALQRLRRECGGLQTLLRNRHQVFEVLHGRVRIRDWRRELQRPSPAPEAFKTRPCWFFTHHPDGCALPAASCPFAHGPGELRPPRPAGRHRPARGAARGAGSAGHAPGPPRSASCDL